MLRFVQGTLRFSVVCLVLTEAPSTGFGAPTEKVTFEQALALSEANPEVQAPMMELQARTRGDKK